MSTIEYASQRLTIAIVDDVHIAVHGQDSPDATDWEAYLKSIRKVATRYAAIRGVVYTFGGNPSGAQRAELNKINEGLQPRVSVMVESRIARGAVTALSWFNPSIKAFAHDNLTEAMAHLGLSDSHAERVRRALDELKAALKARGGY